MHYTTHDNLGLCDGAQTYIINAEAFLSTMSDKVESCKDTQTSWNVNLHAPCFSSCNTSSQTHVSITEILPIPMSILCS